MEASSVYIGSNRGGANIIAPIFVYSSAYTSVDLKKKYSSDLCHDDAARLVAPMPTIKHTFRPRWQSPGFHEHPEAVSVGYGALSLQDGTP